MYNGRYLRLTLWYRPEQCRLADVPGANPPPSLPFAFGGLASLALFYSSLKCKLPRWSGLNSKD